MKNKIKSQNILLIIPILLLFYIFVSQGRAFAYSYKKVHALKHRHFKFQYKTMKITKKIIRLKKKQAKIYSKTQISKREHRKEIMLNNKILKKQVKKIKLILKEQKIKNKINGSKKIQ
jgi:hypothetical protein